ncbi:MAG TPA: arginase [Candidatus Limnocylindria bacterium]|nr:arginase [Candidatus Limnocylindria bacterium]
MRVEIVGVPMDLGGNRRGVDMGPSAIRYAGLRAAIERIGVEVRDHGNIKVADRVEQETGSERARHAAEIVRAVEELAGRVAAIVRGGAVPVVLGGDHAITIGTLAGLARAGRRPGVVYFDAHADINTPETTPSGNVHGMPLAVVAGIAGEPFPRELRGSIDGKHLAVVAVRSVDRDERQNIPKAGATVITMADIDRDGMARSVERAIAVASAGQGIHVSLDMDAIDPDQAPGVGTPVTGGLTYREAQLAMEMLAATKQVVSIEVAEVNPVLDRENRTAALAVELVASALGQTIL